MKVKKNVSLDENLVETAKIKAKKMGFDFSAYITYLINKDIDGTMEVVEKVKPKNNSKISSAIDNIMG